MKKILFFGLFLCLGMTLKAQYGGEMTIGARLNYTGGGKLVTYDGKIVNLGYTIKGIVSPGYFVTNNIALGADLAYEYMMDDEGHQYTLETGGFFRLYAPKSNKKEKPNGGFEILNFKPPFLFSKKEYARYAKVAA